VAAEISGSPGRLVKAVASLDDAGKGDLCFCSATAEDAAGRVAGCRSDVIIVSEDFAAADAERTLIRTRDPMLLFVRCLEHLFPGGRSVGISECANVHPDASIGKGVVIEPFAMVEQGCEVGEGAFLAHGASIREGSLLGRNVRVGPNTAIGVSGLAYGKTRGGEYVHFRHLGRAIIEDNIDIGSGCAVARGILKDTIIGRGTKVGNLVNIGHNVTIGRNCFVSASVTLCGSVEIEDDCWIAAGVTILNHVRIGRGATVSLGAVVSRDVPPGTTVAGFPARALPKSPS
jgi:UDP-3-O-[3-hydroxymyristoyl] glucosamine N-acyltransferase